MDLKRIWIEISGDKRKLSVLATAVTLGLLLWARVIVIAKMPRSAVADPAAGTPGQVEPAPADSASDKSAKRRIEVTLSRDASRDPFVISPTHFPEVTSVNDLAPDGDKSSVKPVEDQEQVRARRQAQLRALVERFELEAVMTGQPLAVMSGVTYRQGDLIPAIQHGQVRFLLSEVRPRSVVLECEGYRFELVIARPGDQ